MKTMPALSRISLIFESVPVCTPSLRGPGGNTRAGLRALPIKLVRSAALSSVRSKRPYRACTPAAHVIWGVIERGGVSWREHGVEGREPALESMPVLVYIPKSV
jgi:hypothetical protein